MQSQKCWRFKMAEQEVWLRKDAQIISQSCLNRATEIVMGLGASGLDPFTLENIKKRIKETAADLSLWVYGNVEVLTAYKEAPNVLPEPTAEQKKVLNMIKFDGTEEEKRRAVLQWAKDVHNVDYYPKNTASAEAFMKWEKK